MNKILLIELKDTNALIIFAKKTSHGWSILLCREYEYESDNTREIQEDNLASFDLSWIPKMKADVTKIFPISKIDDIFLVINTYGTLIEIKKYDVKTIDKTNETFIRIVKDEISSNTKLKLLNYCLEEKIETPLHKKLKISYEYVNKKILEDVKKYLETFGIRITKVISSKDAIIEALKPYMNRSHKIINIQIEDKFTSYHYLKESKFASSIKKNQGLNLIYRKIAKDVGITVEHARELFSTFGNIPPEIIKDNRIIFNGKNLKGERIVFTKKDLSKIITVSVNEILKDIVSKIKEVNISNFEIIFSGKVTKLNGFENYAKERLNIKNVSIFRTNLVGLNSSTEIISMGAIYAIEKTIAPSFAKVIDKTEFNLDKYFSRRKNVLSIFKDKFKKYYNYI